MDNIWSILKQAFSHTIGLVPFIFLVFVLIEIIETKAIKFAKKKRSKNIGPVTWATVGLFPHCGVGIIGAKLFSKKYITMGSLLAIIMTITDEAIFMLLDHPKGWSYGLQVILLIIIIKFVYAIIVGYLVDNILSNKLNHAGYENLNNELEEVTNNNECCGVHKHGYDHSKDSKIQRFLIHPLKHAIPLIIFIFIVNFLLEGTMYLVGKETFAQFFNDIKLLQPLIAVLIGLIPNCAGSVILIGLHAEGALIFPALVGGLINQAGLSKMILLKENKNVRENLLIIAVLSVSGLLLGYVLMLFI